MNYVKKKDLKYKEIKILDSTFIYLNKHIHIIEKNVGLQNLYNIILTAEGYTVSFWPEVVLLEENNLTDSNLLIVNTKFYFANEIEFCKKLKCLEKPIR